MIRRIEEDKRLYARAYEAGKKFAEKEFAEKIIAKKLMSPEEFAIIQTNDLNSEGVWSLGLAADERGQVFHTCRNQNKKFRAGRDTDPLEQERIDNSENFHGQSDFICPNCLAKKRR